MMAQSDLERAVEALHNKQARYDDLWKYYDGDQPLVYSTERLKSIFGKINARFSLNWCAVVIDSELDRIQLKQFEVAKRPEVTARLNELFEETELELDADDVHQAALVTGEAFVIVWKDDQGAIEAYYNDPRMCHVFYDEENPRQKRFAAKWWVADEKRYLTLYYADRLEYYVSRGKAKEATQAKAFVPTEEGRVDNPFNIIPVFHFRAERRKVKSALKNVIEPQNAVNKLLADMMVAAEFGAFKQRWVITNADTKGLKNAPNEIWEIPAGDGVSQPTSVGEFSETNLINFFDPMDKLASSIAIITRTPKHYFWAQGGDPSGEALIAMEAPLNKKANRHLKLFGVTWRRLAAFMLQLAEIEGVTERDIQAVFDPPETIQPRTQAEIRQINAAAGLPLPSILREEGRTEREIDQVLADRATEAASRVNLADVLLESAERGFNAGDGQQMPLPIPG